LIIFALKLMIMIPTEQRLAKFKSIIAKKQFDFGVVLENVHNPQNVGAVLRSCDAVGVIDVFLIYSSKRIDVTMYEKGKRSARGADKWLNVHVFDNVDECMKSVKSKYDQVLATNFTANSKSLYDLELAKSVALVFGNERDGISTEMMEHVDGNFIIPQEGMVQSLNISVACAISLYEGRRQRSLVGKYDMPFDANNENQNQLLNQYLEIHKNDYLNRHRSPLDKH